MKTSTPAGDLAPAPAPDGAGPTGPRDAPSPLHRRLTGLAARVVGLAAGSAALVAVILGLSFGQDVKDLLERELGSRARLAAVTLANSSANLLFAQDTSGLAALTAATRADVPGAAYVIVRDERGRVLAEDADASLGEARPPAAPAAELELGSRAGEGTLRVGGRDVLHAVALVTFKGGAESQYLDPLGLTPAVGAGSAGVKVLGSVELGFPLAELGAGVAAASRRAAGLALVALLACLVLMVPAANVLTRPLTELSRAALGIAGGDLRQEVRRSGSDEVADLAGSFRRMVAELQAMLGDLREAAGSLARDSDAMLAAATRQAATATQTSASITQMNASIQEIAQTSGDATAHADRVIDVTRSAEESSRAGEGLVEQAVRSTREVEGQVAGIGSRLEELSGRAGQIGATISRVRDLAQRTNVLALNAAIQAARAGDAGASFTVIAREMRALAEQSSATAGEVPALLGEIAEASQSASTATLQGVEKAKSTAALAQRAGATIASLAEVCRESAEAARLIADISRQQATGVTEIVAALRQLGEAGEGSVRSSEETREVAERLKAVSGRLTRIVERYRS